MSMPVDEMQPAELAAEMIELAGIFQASGGQKLVPPAVTFAAMCYAIARALEGQARVDQAFAAGLRHGARAAAQGERLARGERLFGRREIQAQEME